MDDYLLEKKLKETSPELNKRVADSVVVLKEMLDSFLSWFPDFTDHSLLHSMDVLFFANNLLGKQVDQLSSAECYVLIMSCYLHDIGMGLSQKEFDTFIRHIDLTGYRKKRPNADTPRMIRDLHNELSGLFIRKYANMFDIPSEDITFAIVQVSRGHRKTDLLDEKEYPDIMTSYGVIRTAYLAAILRLADEIDVGAERNSELLFDTSKLTKQVDIDAFGTHESIREVILTDDAIILRAKPKEPRFVPLIEELAGKIQETLDYCSAAAEQRSDLRITQQRVEIEWEE
ncbi:MAG: hypothetical protein K5695_11595 [Oscillospiraceae bacterium]|nr:hypothetical protein [Oscillospiraceae bacterium]